MEAVALKQTEAMIKAFSKKKHEMVEVDLEAELKSLGLDRAFAPSQWPPLNATRELATKLKKA